MTQDEITKLIETNGLNLHGDIEHFAALVAAHEREACAKICDDGYFAFIAAGVIRERGEA